MVSAVRFSCRWMVSLGVLGALAGFGCDDESAQNEAKGGSAGTGGDAGEGQGGATVRGGADSGGRGGVSGAGASGAAGEAGAAGGDNGCAGGVEPDECAYPESLGGGGEDGICGVTPNAWYPLGNSARDWPERGSGASGGLVLHGSTSLGASSYEAPNPHFALDEAGRAAVTAACEVFVLEDGGTWPWQTPPESFALDVAVDGCEIAIDRAGQPLFTHWHGEGSSSWEGHAERWTASGWEPLPGPFRMPHTSDWGPNTSVTFDSANVPYLAWEEFYNDESELYAVRFNAKSNAWEPIGPTPILPAGTIDLTYSPPVLSHGPNGELALLTSINGEQTVVLEWNGDEWLDRSEEILNVAGRRHLTHDDTGAPVLHAANEEELLLFRWSGTEWEALEPSDSTLAALPEHVRFDAWKGAEQVYVRRFSQCGWRELSASARGGGVSNAPAGTTVSAPSLAVGDGRVCVAWTEDETNPVVFIRCHDLPSD